MPARFVETVIVGAGQAGLVVSRLLSDRGREHVLLERRASLGGGWQDRWDGFRLVSPNWTVSVPGLEYGGPEPEAFMPRDELVDHWRRYSQAIAAPVELQTEVLSLVPVADGAARFELETTAGRVRATTVVVAAGPFGRPHIPGIAAGLSSRVLSLHVHEYRSPDQLPPGGVLLVGSGQSGVQLAEELSDAGRAVTIAVGRCGRAPRRYRGRDIFWWLRELGTRGPEVGLGLPTPDRLPTLRHRLACNPQLSGHKGGHDVNLRRMAADGSVRLAGRLDGLDGTMTTFRPDLAESLVFADRFFAERLQGLCDAYALRAGLDAPAHEADEDGFDPPEVERLDLRAEGIGTILWTSGYRPDLDWVTPPVFDADGLPRQDGGQSEVPGLAFIGTPWLVDMGSANLIGLVRDAEALVARLTA